MKLLAFSDLHCDLGAAADLVERSLDPEVDAVIGAGDFASVHEGLGPTIDALSAIEKPAILVPGNNETEQALREACAGWAAATVLHGEAASVEVAAGTIEVFGLGAGIPTTPWDWSFDLDEQQAARILEASPGGPDLLALHSPPYGHCDRSGAGEHLGSRAIATAIEAKRPRLAVCGHIHESWGEESAIGASPVVNLGPAGRVIEL